MFAYIITSLFAYTLYTYIFVCIKKYIDQKGDNFFVSPHFQPPLLFWRSCNGERHATKRFRNETNAIYYSFSFQPAVNWSTIGHLWLFCASGGGTFVLPVVAHLLTPNLPKRTKHKNTKMSRLVEKSHFYSLSFFSNLINVFASLLFAFLQLCSS